MVSTGQGGQAKASVVLSLSDVNNQSPQFILENQPANTVVMSVSTRDLDEAENSDSKIGERGEV